MCQHGGAPPHALHRSAPWQEQTDDGFRDDDHRRVLTDAAVTKVRHLLEQEGREDLQLRIAVQPAVAPACATSCSSTSVPSTVTRSSTSAA